MKRKVDYKEAWEKEGKVFQSELDCFLERKKAGVHSYWSEDIKWYERILERRIEILKQCTKREGK